MALPPLADAEAHHLQDLRSRYAVPIQVFATAAVPAGYYQAALQGVLTTLKAAGFLREVQALSSTAPQDSPVDSPDAYVRNAYQRQGVHGNSGYGPQCVVDEILDQWYRDPWQALPRLPHLSVMVVDCDITSRKPDGTLFNFAFGATYPDLGTVQSMIRLRTIKDPALRIRVFERVIEHETGHLFGLNQRAFHVEQRLGIHCSNVCVMRQGVDLPALCRLTQEEQRANIYFCADCLAELAARRAHYQPVTHLSR
jgi:predicted Zn-dependent protease